MLYIAFSRYGAIRLGSEEPEFPTVSWGHAIAAGIGSGMLYWSAIEWAYVQAPPWCRASSDKAYDWAASYGCITGASSPGPSTACRRWLPIRFMCAKHRNSNTATRAVLAKGRENSWAAHDSFFMIALIGGAGSSLGIRRR